MAIGERRNALQEFISEDDLKTFDGWLKYQGVDPETTKPDDLETWRGLYEEGRERTLAMPKVGSMKIQRVPGEHLYAVAVREGSDLWLTMWVRHSRKGEFFAMLPRLDHRWDAHASYHLDGTLHIKSDDGKCMSRKCQPLTGIPDPSIIWSQGATTAIQRCVGCDVSGFSPEIQARLFFTCEVSSH